MSITTVLFDLDGTLLPMDQDVFVKAYFEGISKRLAAEADYDPEELVATIWKGIVAMMKNDGSRSNRQRFEELFASVYGQEKAEADQPLFDKFYVEDFDKIQKSCGYTPDAATLITHLKDRGVRCVLATNPLFPAIATRARIRWAGLEPEDFVLYTTYENTRYCKPTAGYYNDILTELGLVPEECMMVGNDVDDDMPAAALGMKVFLLTDCLINRKGKDISEIPQGNFADLTRYIDSLI